MISNFFSLEQQTKSEIKTGACERERGERVCVAGGRADEKVIMRKCLRKLAFEGEIVVQVSVL